MSSLSLFYQTYSIIFAGSSVVYITTQLFLIHCHKERTDYLHSSATTISDMHNVSGEASFNLFLWILIIANAQESSEYIW
jgi:hypothetical protein